MGTFYLKENDTRPALSVTLLDPDEVAYDLTGATTVYLNITLSDGTQLQKEMTVDDDPTTGIVTYDWLTADWDSGGLVVSPPIPLPSRTNEHKMEYEVVGPTAARLTFPNSELGDILRITSELGQGA